MDRTSERRTGIRWDRLVLISLVGSLTTASLLMSQGFTGTAEVTLVEIPVQVVRDGKAVVGLTRDDFEIIEGKKRHAIRDFDVIDLDESGSDDVPLMARRHVLFLFDLSSLDPATVARAQTTALRAARNMLHPADVAAVGSYSPARDAELVLGFTPDRAQLSLAIETMGVPGLFRPSPDALGLVLGDAASTQHTGPGLVSADGGVALSTEHAAQVCQHARTNSVDQAKADANQRRGEIAAKSRSFAALAELLAGVDGRKQVILFSAGFDSDLFFGAGHSELDTRAIQSGDLWDVDGDQIFGSTRVRRELDGMLDAFRRADAVIQTIDLGRDAPGRSATVGAMGDRPQRDRAATESLFFLANETGGGLHRGAGDLSAALQRGLERSRVTYLLTFEPRDLPMDGTYRPITVRLKKRHRGMRVTHRSGYFAPKPWSDVGAASQRLATAELVAGAREGGSLVLDLVALPLATVTTSDDLVVLPYLVRIKGAPLLESHYGDRLDVELHLYAFDAAGQVAGFHNQTLALDLATSKERLARAGLLFYDALALPAGDYRLRLVVRNNVAWTWGVHTAWLTIPATPRPNASPPSLVPTADWIVARGSGATAVPYPYEVDGEIWMPARASRSPEATSLAAPVGSVSLP